MSSFVQGNITFNFDSETEAYKSAVKEVTDKLAESSVKDDLFMRDVDNNIVLSPPAGSSGWEEETHTMYLDPTDWDPTIGFEFIN